MNKICIFLWTAGVITGGYLVVTILSIGSDSWKMALIITVLLSLLAFASFPFKGKILIRKIAFYIGLAAWLLLTLAILRGMFGAPFVSHYLIFSGITITLLTTSAVINNSRKAKK